jgi:outer membrane protein assembly factor BamB
MSAWPVRVLLLLALTDCNMQQNALNPIVSQQISTAHTRRAQCGPSECHTDWDSFGFDLQRTGYNPDESAIGADNVGNLQEVWGFNVGSTMVHEPVYAYDVDVKGVATNILYAGSAWGHAMYAINAETGGLIWERKVDHSSYTCGERTKTQFSIGETPAIDRQKNRLYFNDGHNFVHAVNLATGREATGWPLEIAHFEPDRNLMHGGFTYNPSNGLLYAVTGSSCDRPPWYGRIVAIDTKSARIVGTFFPMSGTSMQGPSGGGVWGPGGASIDPATNDVFIATGNADTHSGAAQNSAYAEQVIELSPTLSTILANNYPTNIPDIPHDDNFDFGATPLLFQPPGCPPLLAAINKSGMFELYDRGSIGNGPIQYIAMSIPTDIADFIGVPAYDPVTGYVYVGLPATEGIYLPGLAAFAVESNCTLNPTPVWSAHFGPDGAQGGETHRSPISIANGVVYVSNFAGDTEFAFNAATGAQLWTLPLPSWGRQGTVIVNGMAYISSDDGTITAWAPPASAHQLRKHAVGTVRLTTPPDRWSTPWCVMPTDDSAAGHFVWSE